MFKMAKTLYAILSETAKTMIREERCSYYHGGKPNGTSTECYIGKTRVIVRQGVVQSELPEFGPISDEIAHFIVGVVFCDTVLNSRRINGTYHLPGEETDSKTYGTVDRHSMLGGDNYNVTCYGATRENVLKLYNLIRLGTIRPADDGWDREQAPGGIVKLKEDLAQARSRLEEAYQLADRLEVDLAQARRGIVGLEENLALERSRLEEAYQLADRLEVDLAQARSRVSNTYQLAADLNTEYWPFCTKEGIVERIHRALNGVTK